MTSAPDPPFVVRYHAEGFPEGMIERNGEIRFYENELVHALFTVGRAPGDRLLYGDASVWEFLHRSSIVRAYIRQDDLQRLVLSRLATELDQSEKSAVMYIIGQAMTSMFCQKLLSVQFLMHVGRYASRWSLGFANRKRADLFGQGRNGWIVAEAKGRSTAPNDALRNSILQQKSSVVSIQGKPPDLAIGCVAHFSPVKNWLASVAKPLALEVFDPPIEVEPFAIDFDIDRYALTYYEPFINAIEDGAPNAEPATLSTEDIAWGQFGDFNVRVGLLRSIMDIVNAAKSRGNITGLSESISGVLGASSGNLTFPDGSFVETDWRHSITSNDWSH
jgi:hypothetical protein